MKKIIALAMALCLAMTVTAAFADTTVVKAYAPEELTGNTFHSGFVGALNMSEENTVELKDDGTYSYTKRLYSVDEKGEVGAEVVYTFIGTYTQDGDTVVLAFPTDGTFSENWGGLASMGYFNNTNGAFNDVVQCKNDESHMMADIFDGPYMQDSHTTSDPAFDPEDYAVTITISGDTFEYVITEE